MLSGRQTFKTNAFFLAGPSRFTVNLVCLHSEWCLNGGKGICEARALTIDFALPHRATTQGGPYVLGGLTTYLK